MQIIHGDKEALLSIGEAAKASQVSISTLRRYEKRGLITPLRTPGNQRRYRRGDVEKLIRPAVSPRGDLAQQSDARSTRPGSQVNRGQD